MHNIRFSQIWYKVKKPNQMELFRIHLKEELIKTQNYNETKYNNFCEYFLHDRKTFSRDSQLKEYCLKMFNLYKNNL
ncbi:hypothetical protein Msip34_2070 [Methylovorus glucosotrophus SIP3-4]|uniref:Uncharacterized protein n=1 Tax=Methylovorus glucosotrophus (strain SIP3-4) TaxID=582744 RepID=C6X7Y5_METGS|nr:hypothetical protein Msip34_2070 [Methylovorus glucosotrophus SIP3-4]